MNASAGWSGGRDPQESALCPAVQIAAAVRVHLGHPYLDEHARRRRKPSAGAWLSLPLDLSTLHLGPPRGHLAICPTQAQAAGPGQRGLVDTPPGPSCPHGTAPLPGEDGWYWLALDSLNRKCQAFPRQGLCSEPDSADGSVCPEQVGWGSGVLPGPFPGLVSTSAPRPQNKGTACPIFNSPQTLASCTCKLAG